jgi:hypothetical protein
VPVEALAAALDGQPAPREQSAAEYRDPRVDQLMAQLQRNQQSQQQAVSQRAQSDVAAFAAKAEFLTDVQDEVADIIELSAKRGREMTLEQAYERATKMHPEISKVLSQREAAKTAATAQATAQKTRAASSSVRSQPAPAGDGSSPSTLRGELEASIAALSGR